MARTGRQWCSDGGDGTEAEDTEPGTSQQRGNYHFIWQYPSGGCAKESLETVGTRRRVQACGKKKTVAGLGWTKKTFQCPRKMWTNDEGTFGLGRVESFDTATEVEKY